MTGAMTALISLPFLTGEATASARDALLFFHDSTLMAMKWKQFKLYLKRGQTVRMVVTQTCGRQRLSTW